MRVHTGGMLKADWKTGDALRLSMMEAVQPFPSLVTGILYSTVTSLH
jgi:hypothetical protein